MPSTAVFRCPKCGQVYNLLDAGHKDFYCCGRNLERVESRTPWSMGSVVKTPRPIPIPNGHAEQYQVLEVTPARETTADVLAVETMLTTFSIGSVFSLEIAGDARRRRLLIRGSPETLEHLRRQIQATYDQVSFRPVPPDEDPARPSTLAVATADLTLRRGMHLPLRTYRDGAFEEADPVRGLLSALDGFEGEERALAQIILRPAPSGWSTRYAGSAKQIEQTFTGERVTVAVAFRQFISVMTIMMAVAFGLWALFSFLQHAWLAFITASVLFSATVGGVMWLYQLMVEQTNVDPELVRVKIATPAYDANIRLFVFGNTPERARARLRGLVAAYGCANLESGNAFVGRQVEFDPRVLVLEPRSWWKEWIGRMTRLNVSELAGLWHLPLGPAMPLIRRTLAKRILPLPEQVSRGVLIGYSNFQDKHIPVRIAPEILAHNVFMVAKTQKGKSTLMARLAVAAMREDAALVVVDPHGDLARSLLNLIPPEREGDVSYLDFGDTQQVVGFNLLDMNQGRSARMIVNHIMDVGKLIWSDFWGPRMSDALRVALDTLVAANEKLALRGEPQFTLIDVPSLFEFPAFRRRLVEEYATDSVIKDWWNDYYEKDLHDYQRLEVINPVLTKIHAFSTDSVVRNIIGQSNSTVNLRTLVRERRIILVNTATGLIGPEAAGLLGAVLIDHINFSLREQTAVPDREGRTRAVIVIDEFQSIPGVNYPSLLGETQKVGASFILATQALGPLKTIYPNLKESIFSNIAALFVFQTSAEDADLMRHELDNEVTPTDIINLDDYACYLKTQLNKERLAIMHVDNLPADTGTPPPAERTLARTARDTRPCSAAEASGQAFRHYWLGRERNLRHQLDRLDQGDMGSRPNSPKEKPDQNKPDGSPSDSSKKPDLPESPVPPTSSSDRPGETPPSRPSEEELGTAPTEDGRQPKDPPEKKEDPSKGRKRTPGKGKPPESPNTPQPDGTEGPAGPSGPKRFTP